MIPGNIDLTEHRDFGDSNGGILSFLRISEVFAGQNSPMTNEEYEKIRRYEELFGSDEMHSSQSLIFDVRKSGACCRCGKTLKIPWRKKYMVCDDCYSQLYPEKRIPWKEAGNVSWGRDTFSELFNLK